MPGGGQAILSDVARFLPVAAPNGMVAAREAKATRIGVAILERGGNAVDAAVAVGFALAVTLPRAGNLGGGGFMLVHLAERGETVAIDYRETAPAAASPTCSSTSAANPIRANRAILGLSVSVPGTVRGLAMAHERYGSGRFTLAELIAPAERLAREGPGRGRSRRFAAARRRPARALPSTRNVFFNGEKPFGAGERLIQPDLAETLAAIGREGPAPSTRDRSLKKSPPPSATPAAS